MIQATTRPSHELYEELIPGIPQIVKDLCSETHQVFVSHWDSGIDKYWPSPRDDKA